MTEPTNPRPDDATEEWQGLLADVLAQLNALGADDDGNCYAVTVDGARIDISGDHAYDYAQFDLANLRPDDRSALGGVWGQPQATAWVRAACARAWLCRDGDDTMGLGFMVSRMPGTVMMGIADTEHLLCVGMSIAAAERAVHTMNAAIAWAKEHESELQQAWTAINSGPERRLVIAELLSGRRGVYVLPSGVAADLDGAIAAMPDEPRNEFLRERVGVEIVRKVRGAEALNARLAMVRAADTEEEFTSAMEAILADAAECIEHLDGPIGVEPDGTVTFHEAGSDG